MKHLLTISRCDRGVSFLTDWQRLIVAVLICSEFREQVESGDITFFMNVPQYNIFSNGTWNSLYKIKNKNIKEWSITWFVGTNLTSQLPIFWAKTWLQTTKVLLQATNIFNECLLEDDFRYNTRQLSFHSIVIFPLSERCQCFLVKKSIWVRRSFRQTDHASFTDIPNVTHHVTCAIPWSKHKKIRF